MANKFNPLAAQYLDTGVIVQLVDYTPNDQELGEAIRTYLASCSKMADNDELFPKYAPMVTIGRRPSEVKTLMVQKAIL